MTANDKTLAALLELVNLVREGKETGVKLDDAVKAVSDYIVGKKAAGEVESCCGDCDADDDIDIEGIDSELADTLQSVCIKQDDQSTIQALARILATVAGYANMRELSMVAHGIWLDA